MTNACTIECIKHIRNNKTPKDIVDLLKTKYSLDVLAGSLLEAYEQYYDALQKKADSAMRITALREQCVKDKAAAVKAIQSARP